MTKKEGDMRRLRTRDIAEKKNYQSHYYAKGIRWKEGGNEGRTFDSKTDKRKSEKAGKSEIPECGTGTKGGELRATSGGQIYRGKILGFLGGVGGGVCAITQRGKKKEE